MQREFKNLKDTDETRIYKLVGPVLLKQEKTEAVGAVDGRLEFIGKEINRTEDRIKELQEGKAKIEKEAVMLQSKMEIPQ